MKFGLTDSQYQMITEIVVRPLRSLGNEVYCFGSRARNDHSTYSDLDLMIEGTVECQRQIAGMKETLSNSNFPFKVDLVLLKELASSYLASYYQDRTRW